MMKEQQVKFCEGVKYANRHERCKADGKPWARYISHLVPAYGAEGDEYEARTRRWFARVFDGEYKRWKAAQT